MTQTEIPLTASAPVVAEVVVNVPQHFAFEAFAKQGAWWPKDSHHIGKAPAVDVIIEPKSGGRWMEIAADGTECPWATVLVYDPFGRMLFGWHLNAKWEFDADFVTEVEVTFTYEGPETTRVRVEHRNMERFGADAAMVSKAYASDNGWTGILKLYADNTSATTS